MQPLGVHLVISVALTYTLSRFIGHNSVDVGICDPYSHQKQHPPGEGMAHATADSRQSERHGKGCRGRVSFRKKLRARRPGLTFEGVEMIEIY